MTDPRALCAAEKHLLTPPAGHLTTAREESFLAGIAWARHAAGPPESPADDFGNICGTCGKGSMSLPQLEAHKCPAPPASPMPEEELDQQIALSLSSDHGALTMVAIRAEAALAGIKSAEERGKSNVLYWMKKCDQAEALLAEAKQQGRAEGARIVAEKCQDMMSMRTTERVWEVVTELEKECRHTPSKGD